VHVWSCHFYCLSTAHLWHCTCILVETIHPLKHKQHLKLFIQYIDQRAKNRSEYWTAYILVSWMYSWLWVKLKLCQYKFIMVSKRAQNQVKETPMQPYQTIVSIEWQPCFVHRCSKLPLSMPKKYCNYLSRDSRLEFALSFAKRVPLELSSQSKGDLAVQ